VQALRAIAAASVVVHHVLAMLVHNAGYSFAYTGHWSAGVDLFFVISGFVMVYTHSADFGTRGASLSFTRRRVIRIAPLYWLITTIVVVLLIAAPRLFASIELDWTNVACSYLFLLSANSIGDVGTVTQTGWTLCFEAYFYLVFTALLLLPRHYFLVVAGAVFGIGLVIGASSLPVAPWATVAVRPLILEFYLGTVIAFLFLRGHSLPAAGAVFAIVLGISGIALVDATNDWKRVLFWGGGSGLVLAGAVSLEHFGIRVPRTLIALGASSYSLYLVHPLVVPPIGKVWATAGLSNLSAFAPGTLAFAAALLIAHGVYLWIEKPMTERLKNAAFPLRLRDVGAR
jgi:peptidoglycan/LPS O-acetylase OafA/YrhL